MKKYILDSNALLCFFQKENSWQIVANLFKDHLKGRIELLMSIINFGEFLYILKTRASKVEYQKVTAQFDLLNITMIETDLPQVLQAVEYKSLGGIAYPDCFVLALSKKFKATVVTGDKEFKKFSTDFEIEWL
ncbi:MAG: type II toxin-antitoxin system VapC family toxin [bacterium]